MIDDFSGRYAFLSNYSPYPVEFDGRTWRTVEAAFQAAKTDDTRFIEAIFEAQTPGEAKRLGRVAPLRGDWEQVKDDVMREVIYAKFAGSEELCGKLLDTEGEFLREGNTWHDNYWGDCRCARCADKPGKNRLGEILMSVREELAVERKGKR